MFVAAPFTTVRVFLKAPTSSIMMFGGSSDSCNTALRNTLNTVIMLGDPIETMIDLCAAPIGVNTIGLTCFWFMWA